MTNVLAAYIPAAFQEVAELSSGPIHVYRHQPTGAPLAVVVGCHAGEIVGGILYFRESTDQLNMEVEAPTSMLGKMLSFVDTQMASIQPRDTMDGVWTRFLDNLGRTLANKTGRSADGTPVPVFVPWALPVDLDAESDAPTASDAPAESDAPTASDAPASDAESDAPTASDAPAESDAPTESDASAADQADANECIICMAQPADTIVAPCLHRSVCAACAPQLEATADARVCCQCRCAITGVYYPDNSVRMVQ